MSRKNVLTPFHLVIGGDMSSSITSATTNFQYLDNIGLQLIYTGAPIGTITLEASLDGATWSTLDVGPVVVNGAGSDLVTLNQLPYNQMRIKYNKTSGTGSLDAYITSKMIGG